MWREETGHDVGNPYTYHYYTTYWMDIASLVHKLKFRTKIVRTPSLMGV